MNDRFENDTPPRLTRHARERIEERNVDPDALALLLHHADLRRRGRDGAQVLRLSRGEAKRLDRKRLCPRRTIERARELEAVIAADALCITTWRLPADPRFRRTGARPSRTRAWRALEE